MWNDRYSAPGYLFGTDPAAFLRREAGRLTAGQTALCVADGEGRNSVFLAELGLNVTAMDGSDVAATKARALTAAQGDAVGDVVRLGGVGHLLVEPCADHAGGDDIDADALGSVVKGAGAGQGDQRALDRLIGDGAWAAAQACDGRDEQNGSTLSRQKGLGRTE